ncbi:MAG: GAF domain-containing protein [Thermomicrobiales bacterium]|nr:GAF domain-containing protein [Thermomicrobiales bacterium]
MQDSRAPGQTNGRAPEELVREERKRYTAQLQRRAQAHVTAELGSATGEEDTDRQVTMLVQHALETTGARRVSLLRPVPRGRRWHVSTVLDDGCCSYGLVAPETLVLSRAASDRRKPVMLGGDYPVDPVLPRLSELGLKSYLGVPIMVNQTAVAVVEAVDVAQTDNLERYVTSLEQAVTSLANRFATEAQRDAWRRAAEPQNGLTEQSVLDLVLRPPAEVDDAIEISPAEWAILNQLNGERPLGAIAQASRMTMSQVTNLASSLLERGLIRVGRENRRRV